MLESVKCLNRLEFSLGFLTPVALAIQIGISKNISLVEKVEDFSIFKFRVFD